MRLSLLAQALDLSERLLRLAGRVARERGADLLGFGLGLDERILDRAGIAPHRIVEVCALVLTVCSRPMIAWWRLSRIELILVLEESSALAAVRIAWP